jgi:hypothetical protein
MSHVQRGFIVVLLATGAVCLTPAALGQSTWTGGAGDGKWESGGNWNPPRVPGPADDVVIPGDSGVITLQCGQQKTVKSLDVQPSTDPNKPDTEIRGDGPGKGVNIKTSGNVRIGAGSTVRGLNGGVGNTHGGGVTIASGGTVTNGGTIKGGDAADPGGKGGPVDVKGDKGVTNDGGMTGGNGFGNGDGGGVKVGSKDGPVRNGAGGTMTGGNGAGSGKGGNVEVGGTDVINDGRETGGNATGTGKGGDVTNKGTSKAKGGKKQGGVGGAGGPGSTTTSSPEQISLAPGDFQAGEYVTLHTSPAGVAVLAGILPGQVMAQRRICIDGGDPATPIDLRGIFPGQFVLIAGEAIEIFGQPLLDPGVFIEQITQPPAILINRPCAVFVGDLNCDGFVDFGDINPFVLALTNPAAYRTLYPHCNIMNGDINRDGVVDFGDINPFVWLLTNP